MIDLLCTLVHFCASCAENANSFTPWAGLMGGGASATGGVSSGNWSDTGPGAHGAGGLAPDGFGPGGLKPGDYGYADPADPNYRPYDLPLQDDPIGNAIPGMLLSGPFAAMEKSIAEFLVGRPVFNEVMAKSGTAISDQVFQDLASDSAAKHFPQLGTEPYEEPNTYHMGNTLVNPDGSTINPDGTPGEPANQTPAYNPDGTRATTDLSNPDPPDSSSD